MSNFFLLNEAIELNDFEDFKLGMSELNSIEKSVSHFFRKHHSIYNLKVYEDLCTNYGQVEQAVIIYIEQLLSCEDYISSEVTANVFCGNNLNGFLGIDFSKTKISAQKQIVDDVTYNQWNYNFSSNLDKLKLVIQNYNSNPSFEKDFNNLSNNIQESIIEQFDKAKGRGFVTPFFPDTKIIKDVSPNNYKCKVLELRVYSPTALRVYFNESNGEVYIASIEQKNNPNQNDDINAAHRILQNIIINI